LSEGLIISPPGSGKTVMALELISRLGQRCLWLTHRSFLADQFTDRALTFLDVEEGSVGVIQGPTHEIGNKVTVGMITTIYDQKPNLRDTFGAVFIDECHHVPAKTFLTVLNQVSPLYLFGITATAYRRDNLEQIMFNALGEVAYQISLKELVEAKKIIIPQIVKAYTGVFVPDLTARSYGALIAKLIRNEHRNRLIVKAALHNYTSHKTIILSSRVEHCNRLHDMLSQFENVRVEIALGNHSQTERRKVAEIVNSGDFDILIATDRLLEEGFDYKPMSKLIFGTPKKSMAAVTQSVGRIMRVSSGKKFAIVYDLIDSNPVFLRQAGYRESRIYLPSEMKVKEIRL